MPIHKTLALKWRPKRFSEIVGNTFNITILKNSISQDKLKNAYFFAGGKGSGKTSTARIFAKAINCQGRGEMDPEPCSSCPSCVEIEREVLAGDVLEIDAASQNSVASIKTLVNQIQYAPTTSKKRVVILDEVHMLSNAASNALLKTLEEPPEHVVFIFCTTDPQKVVDTIRSRTLYFEFAKLTTKDISERLLEVAATEKIALAPEAAELVAQAVNGAMRDAITILDQASILSNEVTAQTVAQIIGYVSPNDLYELFEYIYASQDQQAIKWLDKMVDKLDQDIISSTLQFIETLLLLNVGADTTRKLPPDLADKTKKLSTVFSMKQLFTMGELVKSALNDYRRLALRDSRVILRLMVAGLILAKEDKHNAIQELRTPLRQLVERGRPIEFDITARLRQLLNAEQVNVEDPDPGRRN